jgi:phytoene dehydrogenase-like protein
VRTDLVDGFRLDRGFQVLFTAYPEARALLDYDALGLRRFWPAARVRASGRVSLLGDPFRRPSLLLATVRSPVGTLLDKLRVLRLRQRALTTTLHEIFEAPERTADEELRALGFSDAMIDGFFRPLLGGIFLDPSLRTSSRMLYFVYRMLAEGDTVVPAAGMGAIPAQLASGLSAGAIVLNTRVADLVRRDGRVTGVRRDDGMVAEGAAVVVATGASEAAALSGVPLAARPRDVSCLYFATARPPLAGPVLVLNGDGEGPVLNLAVMTEVSPGCAPAGQHLVACVVMGVTDAADESLERDVRQQMRGWFGTETVAAWRHLRTYRVPWAQFSQEPGVLDPAHRPVRREPGLYVCGDHVENASINGAMASGRRAAEAVLEDARAGRS